MPCPQCQRENPPEASFCNACGAPLPVLCPACSHANPPGSRFCNACGQALARGAVGAAGSQPAVPASYTPAHLAEQIATSRGALEGERKRVTVLFADLKGSMEILADRDPEEARRLLDPLLEHMMEAVHRYEGTVNQVMGDGIMALFGAPIAHEDHAVRACYAALRMQEAATRYGDAVQRTDGVPVQIRVGLNSGEVVVRSIGSDLHMDYTAVGQTTHLAARMEQMAKPGSILIAADTLRLAEGYIQVRSIGPVTVRGLADPVEVFELIGAAATRSRLQVSAARGLTRFVGRDAELDRLARALTEARAGHGQVVALVGEAGVGKSRLVWELTRSYRTEGWLVLEASSVSFGTATALLPVVDLLKAYFEIAARDDARRIRERVAGRVLTLDEGLRLIVPVLLALLGASGDDEAWQRLEAAERRGRALDAVRRLFLRESEVRPTLLVIEDLHWIDPDTQAVLDGLVDSLSAARVLFLVNYRPEYQHGWGTRDARTELRLDPLTSDGAEAFLDALVGGDAGLAPLKALLIARTGGNPFFLEESVRTLVETGVLVGERSAYRLAKPLRVVQVPATVQAVLAARIDRLSPDDKRLLGTAAAIGKDVPLAVLQAVEDGMTEEALRRGLARLQGAEFLYETRLFPEPEYAFNHALTLEVAYGGLLHERRRALHARIVDALERLHPDRRTEQADRLAHHAFRGEVWGKALSYLRQKEVHTAAFSLDAVLGGAESPGYLWWTGDYDRALTTVQRDLAIAASFGHFGLTIVSSFRLGQIHHTRGDYQRAAESLERVVAAVGNDLARETFGMAGLPTVFARAWLGLSLGERGEVARAVAVAQEGLRLAEEAAHPFSICVASFGLGSLYLLTGDVERAVPVLEHGLVLVRVANLPLLLPLVASPLGAAYARSGRAEEGLSLLEQAVERASAMQWVANHSLRLARLAEAHLEAGQGDRAAQTAGQASILAREHGERGNQAYAHCVLGEIATRGDAPSGEEAERAGAAFGQALTLAEELGMRPLLARGRLGLGRLYGKTGRPAEARAEIEAAVALLRAMGLTGGPRRSRGCARPLDIGAELT